MTIIVNRREEPNNRTWGDDVSGIIDKFAEHNKQKNQRAQLAEIFKAAAARGMQPEINTSEDGGISTKWAMPKPDASSLEGFGQYYKDPITGEELQGEDLLGALPPEARNIVKGMVDYTLDPTRVASLRRGMREKYIGAAKQVDPFFDMTQYPTRSKFRQDLATGVKGKNITSFNTAIEHLGELNQQLPNVPSSRFQPLTGAKRWYTEKFDADSPTAEAISKENTALTAVSGELATIFKNTGGTDQEIQKWFDRYDPKMSRTQKQAFIDEGIGLMESRLNAIGGEYERVMGKPYEGSLIHPKAQDVMGSIRSRMPLSYGNWSQSNSTVSDDDDPLGIL